MQNDINRRFANFRTGVDMVPSDSNKYQRGREIREIIGRHFDEMATEMRALGLKVDNCDRAHHVEATIYDWVMSSENVLDVAGQCFTLEGLGEFGDPRNTLGNAVPTAQIHFKGANLVLFNQSFDTVADARNYCLRMAGIYPSTEYAYSELAPGRARFEAYDDTAKA